MVSGGDPGLITALASGEITALVLAAHRQNIRIASVCTGTFFLAAAGVLDHRRAATHWASVEELRKFEAGRSTLMSRPFTSETIIFGRRRELPLGSI